MMFLHQQEFKIIVLLKPPVFDFHTGNWGVQTCVDGRDIRGEIVSSDDPDERLFEQSTMESQQGVNRMEGYLQFDRLVSGPPHQIRQTDSDRKPQRMRQKSN
jgi:hypothetical protein